MISTTLAFLLFTVTGATNHTEGCPLCTCGAADLKLWPFSGCDVSCGARCPGIGCCCITGVGICPRNDAKIQKPGAIVTKSKVEAEEKAEAEVDAKRIAKDREELAAIYIANNVSESSVGVMSNRTEGCPLCTCGAADLKLWPFSGCDVSCGARCPGIGCCCITGVGICPRNDAKIQKPGAIATKTKVEAEEKTEARMEARGDAKGNEELPAAAIYIANNVSESSVGVMANRTEGCPLCTCGAADLKLWPFSGCDVSCGARCPGIGCCCITGVGICPRNDAKIQKPGAIVTKSKVEAEEKAEAKVDAKGIAKDKEELPATAIYIANNVSESSVGVMSNRTEGCPLCTCGAADLKLWPFSGCDVSCGARCPGIGCCCITGVGICPRSDAKIQKSSTIVV